MAEGDGADVSDVDAARGWLAARDWPRLRTLCSATSRDRFRDVTGSDAAFLDLLSDYADVAAHELDLVDAIDHVVPAVLIAARTRAIAGEPAAEPADVFDDHDAAHKVSRLVDEVLMACPDGDRAIAACRAIAERISHQAFRSDAFLFLVSALLPDADRNPAGMGLARTFAAEVTNEPDRVKILRRLGLPADPPRPPSETAGDPAEPPADYTDLIRKHLAKREAVPGEQRTLTLLVAAARRAVEAGSLADDVIDRALAAADVVTESGNRDMSLADLAESIVDGDPSDASRYERAASLLSDVHDPYHGAPAAGHIAGRRRSLPEWLHLMKPYKCNQAAVVDSLGWFIDAMTVRRAEVALAIANTVAGLLDELCGSCRPDVDASAPDA